jgi:hypothetical protein
MANQLVSEMAAMTPSRAASVGQYPQPVRLGWMAR